MIVRIKKYWYCLLLLLVPVLLFSWQYLNSKRQLDAWNNYVCSDCNVVLISIDTLRSDHVSSYGYYRKTTPNIDSFFNHSIYFKNTSSASSWTLPSTMSLMTGLLPSHHHLTNKLEINQKDGEIETMQLDKDIKTLAEVLKRNDYKTGGFTGGAGVDHQFGFSRGFDTYYDKNNFGGFSDSVSESLKWLKENKTNKVFIFLHGYDVHGQFPVNYDKRFVKNYNGRLTGGVDEQKSLRENGLINGSISLTAADTNFLIDLYDEKIQLMDQKLKVFFDEYSKIVGSRKTIFILTSDHGDEFYEHGQIDHGHSLYNELISVPLIVKLPDQNKKTIVNKRVSNLDIFPTIIQLLGINWKPVIDGQSLFQNDDNRQIISETEYRYLVGFKSIQVRSGWKIIDNTKENQKRLFNTFIDPHEKNNILPYLPAFIRRFF